MSTNKTVPCYRCSGSGWLSVYSHVEGGRCFKCQGTGAVTVWERKPRLSHSGHGVCRDCDRDIVWFKSRKGKFYACNSERANDFHSDTCRRGESDDELIALEVKGLRFD